ncbi:MAG: ATP-binding cassette domain-containing protein [Acidobacteriia bacterium]|nr:ATP-binding cassette domain-containing protein [Terriglobia bacterium]
MSLQSYPPMPASEPGLRPAKESTVAPAIEVRKLSISFEEHAVLDNVSFRVREGETKVILGESASGKTVLIKLISGLIKPDSGKVFIFGKEITPLSEDELMSIRKDIGVVFQESALFDSLSVLENVAYRLHEEGGHSETEIEERVSEVLGFVGLEQTMNLMPSDLSGGMKRRVSIARALITHPKIILYDEPTAGLDPLTGRTIVELILRLRDLEGVSSVLVTHRLTDAFTVASERFQDPNGEASRPRLKGRSQQRAELLTSFVVLKNGGVFFDGSEEELLAAQKQQPFIREFLS